MAVSNSVLLERWLSVNNPALVHAGAAEPVLKGKKMMQEAISNILFPDSPYFGGMTCGVQGGEPIRHVLMGATVGLVAPADRPIRILEVGSWIGFSTLTWAEAVARFCPHKGTIVCVDPWSSYFSKDDIAKSKSYEAMDFMGRTGLAYDMFCHNIKFAPPHIEIDHIKGLSSRILPHLRENYFDIIYIDGSHYYNDVINDIRLSDRLLADGGIMCGDDLEMQISDIGREAAERHVLADFVITNPNTGTGFHPGVALAVDEFFGRVSALRGYWHMQKTSKGYCEVSLGGANVFIPAHFPDHLKAACSAFLSR